MQTRTSTKASANLMVKMNTSHKALHLVVENGEAVGALYVALRKASRRARPNTVRLVEKVGIASASIARTMLARSLNSLYPTMRIQAAKGLARQIELGYIPLQPTMRAVASLLHDPHRSVRRATQRVLRVLAATMAEAEGNKKLEAACVEHIAA